MTGNGPPVVRLAESSDKDRVMALMMLSFSIDPPTRWLWPDPDVYQTHYPAFAKAYAGAAFDHGSADIVEGCRGCAMWLSPGTTSDDDATDTIIRDSSARARHAEVNKLIGEMTAYHPTTPVWFLPLIGVDPLWQGQGLGTALLKAGVARADHDGVGAYLNSTNPKNLPLYRRYGFAVLGKIEVGSCPPIFPMLRPPRS